jgi:hypothetical protein
MHSVELTCSKNQDVMLQVTKRHCSDDLEVVKTSS